MIPLFVGSTLSRLLFAAVVAAGTATQASANIIDVIYTGTITPGGVDPGGIFNNGVGISSDAYSGTSFTAEFKFDTALGANVNTTFTGKAGGSSWPGQPTSPGIFAAVTINGVTISVDSSYRSYFLNDTIPGFSQIAHYAGNYNSSGDTAHFQGLGAYITRNDTTLSSLPLTGPINYTPAAGDRGQLSFDEYTKGERSFH
jgi:hypothetical protein